MLEEKITFELSNYAGVNDSICDQKFSSLYRHFTAEQFIGSSHALEGLKKDLALSRARRFRMDVFSLSKTHGSWVRGQGRYTSSQVLLKRLQEYVLIDEKKSISLRKIHDKHRGGPTFAPEKFMLLT